MTPIPSRVPRVPLQRGIIILPSAFTLGNLFFGLYAIIAAGRGDFLWAGWFIVFAGVLDMLDGRVARFTRTGSAFGAELDSLVDAISFGVAPGMILYHLHFADGDWSWTITFVYVTAVVVRLARFNVEQAGHAKSHFHGLPSPTAGMILATYFPFTQTPFFQENLALLPWPRIMGVGMMLLGVLMVSHVPYSVVPRIGLRTARGLLTTAVMLGSLFAALTVPRYFFFPFLVLYTLSGLVKSVLLGLVDRLPERDPLLDEEEPDEAGAEIRAMDYTDVAPSRARRAQEHPESEEERP
ncbi:MAG: CDP-diacylglycerol--serine O-phosphatidyltransferase [Gemmatimonadetes bacterium]|nr:CDP-diacylglycerol--serine O-phosphatidyltransferase [Gemmatimonadota bacterium]